MDPFLADLMGVSAVVTPFVVAVVAGVMQVVPKFPTRYKPVVCVVVGMILAVLWAVQTGRTWEVGADAGFLSGLVAAGLYSFGKAQETAPPRG